MTRSVNNVDASKYGRYMRCIGPYQKWLRWKVSGIENIPSSGPALIIGNHAGFRLHEGWALAHATWNREDSPRPLRPLMHLGIPEDSWVYTAQSDYMGAVPGTPENCLELFDQGQVVMTYPEGAKSTAKPFSDRDKLLPKARWGKGWARLAVQRDIPVIPVGAVGVESAIPTIFRSKFLGRKFKLQDDLYPVSPQTLFTLGQPFLNPLLPFPVKCALRVGDPILPSELPIPPGVDSSEALFDAVYAALGEALSDADRSRREK